MNKSDKQAMMNAITDSTVTEVPVLDPIEDNPQEIESITMLLLNSQKEQSKRTIYVLFAIICALIMFIVYQNYSHTQVLTQFDELVLEEITETYDVDTGTGDGNAIINDSGDVNINGESEKDSNQEENNIEKSD